MSSLGAATFFIVVFVYNALFFVLHLIIDNNNKQGNCSLITIDGKCYYHDLIISNQVSITILCQLPPPNDSIEEFIIKGNTLPAWRINQKKLCIIIARKLNNFAMIN